MSMCFPLKTRSSFSVRPVLVIGFAMIGSLVGCGALSPVDIVGDNQKALIQTLERTPAVCQSYRQAYVRGFHDNVQALAVNDVSGQEQAQLYLSDSREILAESGLSETDCSRPYCIIEPLQNGRLASWCGYRLDADEGADLYQWLDWGAVQTALQRL